MKSADIQHLISEFTEIWEKYKNQDIVIENKENIVTISGDTFCRTVLLKNEIYIFELKENALEFIRTFNLPPDVYNLMAEPSDIMDLSGPASGHPANYRNYFLACGFIRFDNTFVIEAQRVRPPRGFMLDEEDLPTPFYDKDGNPSLTYRMYAHGPPKRRKNTRINVDTVTPNTMTSNLLRRKDKVYYNRPLPILKYITCSLPDRIYERFIDDCRPIAGKNKSIEWFVGENSMTGMDPDLNMDDLWYSAPTDPHRYFQICGKRTSIKRFGDESNTDSVSSIISQTLLWDYAPGVFSAPHTAASYGVGEKGVREETAAGTNISLLALAIVPGNEWKSYPTGDSGNTFFWQPALEICEEGYVPPPDYMVKKGAYFKPRHTNAFAAGERPNTVLYFSTSVYELPDFNYDWSGMVLGARPGDQMTFYGATGGYGCVLLEIKENIMLRWKEGSGKEKK